MQAVGATFAGCLDEFAADAASTPPTLRGSDVLIHAPLCETVVEVALGAGGGDPLGIDEDGIASAFALTGEDDDLPLFGKSSERISRAAITGGGGIVIATMIEVDFAKSLPCAAFIG